MKSTIKSKINRLLKFLGFNVVKAKRPRARKITINKSAETVRVCPSIEDSIRASARTHYVGDDCPGGHRDLPDCCRDHVAVGYQAGTLPAQPDNTAVGTCNTVIGPEAKNFVAECAEKVEHFSNPYITGPTS